MTTNLSPSECIAQEIEEIWKGDLLERQSEAALLARYIESVGKRPGLREDSQGFTISVDADYGIGKSYFLRRLAEQMALTHPVAFVDAWSDDLADEPMILFDSAPSSQNWEAALSRIGIEPRVSMRSRNFEFVRCLVGRGLGYGFLMQRPVSDITYEGTRVVPKVIQEPMPTTSVVLAYLRGAPLSPRAQRFIEFAVQERSERLLHTHGDPARRRPPPVVTG